MTTEKKLEMAIQLLEECHLLLVKHHDSRMATFKGSCPVCTKNRTEDYPNNIFGRIEDFLKKAKK